MASEPTALFSPGGAADAAKGSRPLKAAAVAAGVASPFALALIIIEKLSAEQIVYLFDRVGEKGATFVLSIAGLLIVYIVGQRLASALHKGAKEMGIFAGAATVMVRQMGDISVALKVLAETHDDRQREIDLALTNVGTEVKLQTVWAGRLSDENAALKQQLQRIEARLERSL